jgi:hypothetical protein
MGFSYPSCHPEPLGLLGMGSAKDPDHVPFSFVTSQGFSPFGYDVVAFTLLLFRRIQNGIIETHEQERPTSILDHTPLHSKWTAHAVPRVRYEKPITSTLTPALTLKGSANPLSPSFSTTQKGLSKASQTAPNRSSAIVLNPYWLY